MLYQHQDFGKAVEINALWYNALKIAEIFSNILEKEFDSTISARVENSFEKFYSQEGLYDTIEPLNNKIRPNQIIAIGLEFSPIKKEKAKEILNNNMPKLHLIAKELFENEKIDGERFIALMQE